jgi:hypothetical protein
MCEKLGVLVVRGGRPRLGNEAQALRQARHRPPHEG